MIPKDFLNILLPIFSLWQLLCILFLFINLNLLSLALNILI